ncbi:MAG: hypothetical protein V9H69_07925 [Anaerolineae bacterium]|jgi:hypothetical protein
MKLTTALRLAELHDTPCIALTGAGGKSTRDFRLRAFAHLLTPS